MAKNKRKALLPKRIGGVKVPKSVRKGRLGELLASQRGQALLAEAVRARSEPVVEAATPPPPPERSGEATEPQARAPGPLTQGPGPL